MFEFLYFPCLGGLIDGHAYIVNDLLNCMADGGMSGSQLEACFGRALIEMLLLREAFLNCF